MTTEVIHYILLLAILVMLIDLRLRFGSRMVVMERDLGWIRSILAKWGVMGPLDK